MQRFDLSGRVAIVTGGNGGIGLGIAFGLAECGASVVVAGRSDTKNETAVEELTRAGAVASGIVVDVTVETECQAMVAETVKRHGRLDILVNNAGIGQSHLPQDTTMAVWHTVMNTNLTGAMMCSQAAYSEMKKSGGGKIINIGSLASKMAMSIAPAYAASKGGLVQLGRVCASAWGKDNIQVNCILPGFIATDMAKRYLENPSVSERILYRVPAGRWGTPDDIAGTAIFLASRASDFVTGTAIPVDGGLSFSLPSPIAS
jgi:2-deoxy-D-gluconate 3-dehydrogenase